MITPVFYTYQKLEHYAKFKNRLIREYRHFRKHLTIISYQCEIDFEINLVYPKGCSA